MTVPFSPPSKTQLHNTFGPLALMLTCPTFAMVWWYTNTHLGGSLSALWAMISHHGLLKAIYLMWRPVFFGSTTAWSMIAIFTLVELAFMRLLPGKTSYGPVSPKGNIPVYKDNGVLAFASTIFLFSYCSFYLNLFPASIIYDHLGEILSALNLTSAAVCLGLYFKGRFAPSSSDNGITGNFIFDYYWGTELYPRVYNWDIKQFITCRFGMMSWCLLLISYAAKQQQLYDLSNSMIVCVALQFLYVAKFYVWENGYLRSLDIMHDRAGFYICWGCMVWVPCVYTSPAMYLVGHPNQLPTLLALFIFIAGAACVMINFAADRQRQKVRATLGECIVWGKKPSIHMATYQTSSGEIKQNILLASGWWGVARHFHYIPEIAAAFFWTLPALFDDFTPWFYVIFLTILLWHRAGRDDLRCANKYGKDWEVYCKLVPFKFLPYLI